MNNILPQDLLEKYAANNCTEQERAIVESWYLSELKNSDARPSDHQINKAKEEAWNIIMPPKRISFPVYKWLATAAAIIVAVLAVYLFQPATEKKIEQAGTVLVSSKIENTMMKLPDGSLVILERGSQLTLLPTFNKKYNREVELVGKAFFDIVKDPTKPFIIYSGKVRTTVLGTAFDITAMPGTNSVKVNVIRGLVEVKSERQVTMLKKDMQVVFEDAEVVNRKPVNAAIELSWNRQNLEFKDISIGDAQSRLEEQFGYKISIKDPELRKVTFTYSMRKTESMESFIKSICEFILAEYKIDHKNKIISIEPLNQ